MSNGFWAGGQRAYEKGLKQAHEADLLRLREQLASSNDDVERARLDAEIARSTSEYEAKCKNVRGLLF